MQAEVLVPTLNMEREQWLEHRRCGIGGSDAAAVAGLNRWRSPVAVWLEKTGQLQEQEDSEVMYWGRMLEDLVAQEFMVRTGKKVRRRNAILQHPEYPFMLANVDRLVVGEKAGLECKTTSEWRRNEWEEDRIPDEYLIQAQHYMAVTGYSKWYIACLIGGNKFLQTAVERDDDIIQYLIQIERDFWHLVETGQPPEMDGSEASTKVLSMLYPASNGSEINLPPEAEALIEVYEAAQREEKEAVERKDMAANKLKALLGEYEAGRSGERRVTWKTVSSSRLDTKALKADHPNLCEKYAKASEYRRFQIR